MGREYTHIPAHIPPREHTRAQRSYTAPIFACATMNHPALSVRTFAAVLALCALAACSSAPPHPELEDATETAPLEEITQAPASNSAISRAPDTPIPIATQVQASASKPVKKRAAKLHKSARTPATRRTRKAAPTPEAPKTALQPTAPSERTVITRGQRSVRAAPDESLSFAHLMQQRDNAFIVISKKDYYLSVYEQQPQGAVLLARYDCAIGLNSGNKTRRGDMRTPHSAPGAPFHISAIVDSSRWELDFHDGRGKIRAYGPYFLRLDVPGFRSIGIHGSTNVRDSVPGRASEGCIRLRDEDIVQLRETYAFEGMPVIIKDEATGDLPFETSAMQRQGITRRRGAPLDTPQAAKKSARNAGKANTARKNKSAKK